MCPARPKFTTEDQMSKSISKSKKQKTSNKKSAPKPNAKGATILELLRRKDGATLADLTEATGWQPHSIRGFLSSNVRKKLGLKLASSRREDGKRVYQIAS